MNIGSVGMTPYSQYYTSAARRETAAPVSDGQTGQGAALSGNDSATGEMPPVQMSPEDGSGAAFARGEAGGQPGGDLMAALRGEKKDEAANGECQTCKNRKYQDGSDDPGVSFKSPTNIDPDAVAGAVRGHEMEHVYREQFKAQSEGRKVLYQSVTMHTGICPECGKSYVSGGTTRTVTKGKEEAQLFNVGNPSEDGKLLSAEV